MSEIDPGPEAVDAPIEFPQAPPAPVRGSTTLTVSPAALRILCQTFFDARVTISTSDSEGVVELRGLLRAQVGKLPKAMRRVMAAIEQDQQE